jgi:Protein of unknown function (DUF1552)
MIVTKRAMPRRTFLRGIGVTLALPVLDAMVPAFSVTARTAANPARRLAFVYCPNGVSMNFSGINYWKPKGLGETFELSPILAPFAPFRNQMLVVSGLEHRSADASEDGANGDHARGTSTWLTGVHPKHTSGADVYNGISADQVAAAVIGKDTPLPSLELSLDLNYLVGNCGNGYSCVYMNTLAWRSPTTPLPTENNPRAVFERLFGDGGSAAQRLERARENRSILDSVTADMARLQARLGPNDRTKVSDYLDAVREIERRIQTVETNGQKELPDLERPVGIPERFDQHVGLMFELQRLAFQADVTRVVTFMLGRELNFRSYPEIGITEGHHGLSHHSDNPVQMARYAKVNTYQAEVFASFLESLRSTPDGDGNLLDHSLLLFGAGLSNSNLHTHYDLPLTVFGGAFKGGRHIDYPHDTPMTNLLLSMLDKAGVPAETLGDSSGKLVPEPLSDI